MFGKKIVKKEYDRERQKPVIHCSICTDMGTGKFDEVMLIKTEKDLQAFKEMYAITEISKEY
jgi:hypothetical protein